MSQTPESYPQPTNSHEQHRSLFARAVRLIAQLKHLEKQSTAPVSVLVWTPWQDEAFAANFALRLEQDELQEEDNPLTSLTMWKLYEQRYHHFNQMLDRWS